MNPSRRTFRTAPRLGRPLGTAVLVLVFIGASSSTSKPSTASGTSPSTTREVDRLPAPTGRGHRGSPTVASSMRAASTTAPTPQPSDRVGVYRGSANRRGVRDFEQWLGRPVGFVHDYLDDASWRTIADPAPILDAWAPLVTTHRLVLSIPILPRGRGTLAEGARGAYDETFRELARNLVERGMNEAILRPGWEMNAKWFRWQAAGREAQYAEYWRHIVIAMRGVPGARFVFDWCVSGGSDPEVAARAYPGDQFVDVIGLDLSDSSWSLDASDPTHRWQQFLAEPGGLEWQRAFAAQHHKTMSLPEWSESYRSDGHGGGDDPAFIDHVYEWIGANPVAYAIYFDYVGDGSHELREGRFPRAAIEFRRRFGPPEVGKQAPSGALHSSTMPKLPVPSTTRLRRRGA